MGSISRPVFMTFILCGALALAMVSTADESADETLQARGIEVSFESDESTSISWRNIATNDYTLLEVLKNTTYEVYRSAVPMNTTNVESLTPIASGIEACLVNDSYSSCSGKFHNLVWQSQPGTEGTYHYGVVSVLPNGSRTATLDIGDSQSEAISESVHPVWAPLRVTASYDAENEETTVGWVNADEMGLDVPVNRTIWVWRHLVPVANNTWDDIEKSIVATLQGHENNCTVSVAANTEEEAYYSVTYRYDTWADLRFIGTNTLETPVLEDNVAPILVGHMSATFDPLSGVTNMTWESGVEDQSLSIVILRASHEITSTDDENLTRVAILPYNASSYTFAIGDGTNGEFWYSVVLEDEVGNRIEALGPTNPNSGPLFESTLEQTAVVPNSLAVAVEGAETTITWAEPIGVENMTHHIWSSNSAAVDSECISDMTCTLLGTTSEAYYSVNTQSGVEREVWYAVTTEGIWNGSTDTYHPGLVIAGVNGMTSNVSEDTDAPAEVSDLEGTFSGPDRTATLTWSASEESDVTYNLWRKEGDWSMISTWNLSESGWLKVGTVEGGSGEISATHQVANSNSAMTSTYAISVRDKHGNEDLTLSAGAVTLVKEDLLVPSARIQMTPAGQEEATSSAWMSTGMSMGFTDIEAGMGTLSIQGGESLSSVACRLLGNQTSDTDQWQTATLDGIDWDCAVDVTDGMKVEIKVVDQAENEAFMVVSFKTSEQQVLNQPTDETHDDLRELEQDQTSQLEDENNLLRVGFFGLALLLLMTVIVMMLKTRPVSPPHGKPTSSEDEWIDRFID